MSPQLLDPQAGSKSSLWRKLPGLVVLVGLALSGLAYALSQHNLQDKRRTYFEFRVREAIEMINDRMKAYQQVLRGVSGLFETQPRVRREQFRDYVTRLELNEHYPGIQGVGYVLRIAPQDRQSHIAEIRREGFPDYTIQPEGLRTVYTSIVYIEPFSGRNLRAFGFDMYSEAVRRKAMQLAADSGRMAMSGKVRLQQESGVDEQAGFLIYQPVYRSGQPTRTIDERRANLIGWAYAPFRMDDFLHGLFREQAGDLLIAIYDGDSRTPAALLHSAGAATTTMPRATDTYESQESIGMMGHNWTLHFRSSPSMLERIDNRVPLLLGLSGAALTLLLGALVRALVFRRERAIQTARQMNDELVQERARLNAIIEGTNVGTWEWNVQTGATAFNEQWAHIVGYELAELQPVSIQTWMRLTHPDDLARSNALLQQHFAGATEHYDCEARMRHKLGHWIWVQDRGKVAIWTDAGKPLMMYGTHQDITHRKHLEETYWREAHHDRLTGLPNRALLEGRLDQALLSAQREHKHLALMFIDIDGFKQVNDTYGHEAGDHVLKTIAQRIHACIRASDTLARVGGDEFVLLLPDVSDADHARTIAEEIVGETQQPVPLAQQTTVSLSASIGIAIYPEHGSDAATLTERADRAMYTAKQGGKNAAVLYRDE